MPVSGPRDRQRSARKPRALEGGAGNARALSHHTGARRAKRSSLTESQFGIGIFRTPPSFLHDVQQINTVVQFEAVRSLGTPPPPDAAWWGGSRLTRKFASPSSRFARKLLRQRCDTRGFNLFPIETVARRMVAPAFEPEKASGRRAPASQCNAMDASGPAALSCCTRSQHQACGDYSNSRVV